MRSHGDRFKVDGLGDMSARPVGRIDPHESQPTFSGRGIEILDVTVYGFEAVRCQRVSFRKEPTWQGIPVKFEVRGKRKRIYFDVQLVSSIEPLEQLSVPDQRSLCLAITEALNELVAPLELAQPVPRTVLDLSGDGF